MAASRFALCAIFALASLAALAAAMPTGLNLPALDVYAPHYGGAWASAASGVWANLIKHCTPFEPQSRGLGSNGTWGYAPMEAIAWRPDGYPANFELPTRPSYLEYSVSCKIGAPTPYYAAGDYILAWDGAGSVAVTGDAAVTNSSTPGRARLRVTLAAGVVVRITATNASDPVRNIRLVPTGPRPLSYYDANPFQPAFLALVRGFSVLRFAAWQKVTGDAPARNWTARATPATSSQNTRDGVAVEHMVQLCNAVGAAPFFSLPRAAGDADGYHTGVASYVARSLNRSLTVYIESGTGGPGWMSMDLADRTMRMAAIWRAQWAAAGRPDSTLVVVATYENPVWIPYFTSTFNATAASRVDAIAVLGAYGSSRSFNGPYPCHYEFNSPRFSEDPLNANITQQQVSDLVRSSVIHADLLHNSWRQRVVNTLNKRFIALQGGPDLQMEAAYYASRQNYAAALSCARDGQGGWPPCSRFLYPPASPAGAVVYATEAARDGAAAAFRGPAEREFRLDELLLGIKLRSAATRDQMLDHLWRWDAGGGDLMVVQLPRARGCGDGPGTKFLVPAECRNSSGITSTAYPSSNPVFQAVRDYQANKKGALPLSGSAPPAPPTCSPACKWGNCVKGKCVCYAGYAGPACSNATSRANECNGIAGINLEGPADYAHSWNFVDAMKMGRRWISQGLDGSGGWGNTSGVSVDANGWVMRLGPNQKAGTMLMRDLQGHIPGGTYTVLWEGEGLVDFSMSDVTASRQTGAGRAEVTFKPSTDMNNGIFLTIERTNPANPVRNIKVLMPGFDAAYEAAMPFHPVLLSFLAPFNVVRFMDWMMTNADVLPRSWAERPTPAQRSYSANVGGVPVEAMVKLANHLGAAPWFSMPHLADDDYHCKFAQLVKDTLRPDVKVYVEWGNEIWHTGFPGGKFAQAEGVRLGMNEEGDRWYGGRVNEARLCYYSERTKLLSRAWKEVWGDQAARVVVVAQGQAVWPITSDKILKCRNATSSIDALAIGPYFSRFDAARDKDLATLMNATLPLAVQEAVNLTLPHAAIASKYGKPLLAYEAGQSLVSDNPLTNQANRDGGMYRLYSQYLAGLRGANVSLVCHFSSVTAYSKYGSWGLMEWMDQDPKTAPKLQAVLDFIKQQKACPANSTGGGGGAGSCPKGCNGNGTCSAGICTCFSGYTGSDCSVSVFTDYRNCGYECTFYQGKCEVASTQGSTRNWACTCKEGFSGMTCSIFSCPGNCSWNGLCIDRGICSCYPGFNGSSCEVDCGCNGHGVCKTDNSCACDAGWKPGPGGCEPECSGCAAGAGCIAPGECGCMPQCKYGTCYNGRCECWAGFGGAACDTPTSNAPNRGSPVGMNLAGINYWTTQWVFTDVMKHSSAWWTQNKPDTSLVNPFNTNSTLDLRPDGYPRALPPNVIAHKLTSRDIQVHTMPGRYVALYDGDGEIDFGFDAEVVSVAKGRVEFDFTPTADLECAARGAAYCGDNGIWIVLRATNPANPLRNLRVMQPGFEAMWDRQVFHPWFLKSLERYSVLRFMDWMETGSDKPYPSWAQRATPQSDTQSRTGGVALEHIAGLCNELGAAPWVNVHHLADDDYVRQMAAFLRDNLRPDVKVYVEHSNEVWNPGFATNLYAQQQGLRLGLSTDKYVAAYRYHGVRSEQIFDIFTQAFGAAARKERLQFVVGTWGFACNSNKGCGVVATNETLSMGQVAKKADLVAIAAYFDCGLGSQAQQDALLTVDQMLERCRTSINATRFSLEFLKSMVSSYNLTMATYEAGPSIVEQSVLLNGGDTAGAADKYIALQRDPRFEQVMMSYLEMYDAAGLANASRPLMYFSSAGLPSKFGSWGLIEYTGQPSSTAPKYRAMTSFLDKGAAPPLTSCMDPARGYRGLGDGVFRGLPAILTPAKGDVWVQGVQYNLTWPRAHAPGGPVTVAFFRGTDCGAAPPLWSSQPLDPAVDGFAAHVAITVPDSILGDDVFLRVQGAGPSDRNYSDMFSVQRRAVLTAGGCVGNPRLPVTQPPATPPARCKAWPTWNLTALATGWCEVQAKGCRQYRTSRTAGAWYSNFKPVTDCTALYSPSPSSQALAAAGVPVGPLVPGAPATGC